VAWEFARYKLDLVCVQEVWWNKGGILRAGNYILLKRKRKSSTRNRIFLYHRILSALLKERKRYLQHNYLLLCVVESNRLHVPTLHADHL